MTNAPQTAPSGPADTVREKRDRQVGAIEALLLLLVGAGAFHLAWLGGLWGAAIVVFLYCAARLGAMRSPGAALGMGLLLGLATYLPGVWVLTGGLGVKAAVVAAILVLVLGIFVWMGHVAGKILPVAGALAVLPVVWTGLEYTRSELGPTAFSWLATGLAIPAGGAHHALGVYGVGFVLMAAAAAACSWRGINRLLGLVVAVGVGVCLGLWPASAVPTVGVRFEAAVRPVQASPENAATGAAATQQDRLSRMMPERPAVATLSFSKPKPAEVEGLLSAAMKAHPEAGILVINDYAMDLKDNIGRWCSRNNRYVITSIAVNQKAGGARITLVVTGPKGTVYVEDRLALNMDPEDEGALEVPVFETPWGKMGLVTFHDFSYRRKMDPLIAKGAVGLLVVGRDIEPWGDQGREARSGLLQVRAAEYGVPVLRSIGSPASMLVQANGVVAASGETVAGFMDMPVMGDVPLDSFGAPVCAVLAGLWLLVELGVLSSQRSKTAKAVSAVPPTVAVGPAPAPAPGSSPVVPGKPQGGNVTDRPPEKH